MNNQWQPIETAPRNKTILVMFDRYNYNFMPYYPFITVSDYEEGKGWFHHTLNDEDVLMTGKNTPTHWMPLPDAPAEAKYYTEGFCFLRLP